MLYSDGVERDVEPEVNQFLRGLSLHRLDKLIADLQADQLMLRAALERRGKEREVQHVKAVACSTQSI